RAGAADAGEAAARHVEVPAVPDAGPGGFDQRLGRRAGQGRAGAGRGGSHEDGERPARQTRWYGEEDQRQEGRQSGGGSGDPGVCLIRSASAPPMRKDISPQTVSAGLLSAVVGFASSFAVIAQGLSAVGASQAPAASGLMALSISMGLCAIWLSLRTRLPISIAWSTPGGALLATTGAVEGGFSAAVGAFLVSGLLIVLAGSWPRLGRWVAAIPPALANAMLAGVLLGLCLAPVRAVAEMPLAGLAIVVTWAVVAKFRRLYAVPAAVIVTLGLIAVTASVSPDSLGSIWPDPVPVTPAFSLAALIGIALPLFIVTMASQNIPGMAVLHANDYRPEAGPLFRATGLFSIAAAPFGGHAV